MRHRHHGQVGTHHGGHLGATVARGVDDLFADDLALVRDDAPVAARGALDGGHARIAVDFGARIARALGKRVRELRRVDVAVVRIPQPRDDVVRLDEGVAGADLVRGEQLELDSLGVRLRDDMAELVEAVARVREADAAGDVDVDVVPDLRAQLGIQLRAVALQLDDVPRGGEVRAIAGGVPGRAAGELVALDQHAVAHAEFGEVVQGAAADGAAADHDNLRVRLHAFIRSFFGSYQGASCALAG